MPPESFLHELSAQLIETSQYKEYPEGTLGAIQYLSRQDLSKLQSSVSKHALETEFISMKVAEDKIIAGFRDFLEDGGVGITLTKQEKTENIGFLIEPISYIFSLRNRKNPSELEKLDILKSKKDTSDYMLSIEFKRNPETGAYFIKNIQIRKIEQ